MLSCKSFDCAHNDKNGKCHAKKINIDGRSALTTAGTRCSSYKPEYEFQNNEFADDFFTTFDNEADVENINCQAMGCRYNDNSECTAAEVEINADDASCETFAP